MEQILVTDILISRKKEVHFFQVNLPDNAAQITGFETGVFFKDELNPLLPDVSPGTYIPVRRNRFLGQLKIQAAGKTGYCFKTNITCMDANIGQDDFWGIVNINDVDTLQFHWQSQQFTHGRRQEKMAVCIHNPVLLYGCFTDGLGKQLDRHFEYRICLYTWFTLKQTA